MEEEKNQKNKEMGYEKNPGENSHVEDNSQVTNEDLEEFDSVSNEIDSINAFLDSLESNVDNIKDQLMTILTSNREIMKELKDQKVEETGDSKEADEQEKPMDI